MQFIFLLKRYFIILLSSIIIWFWLWLLALALSWNKENFKWQLYLTLAVEDKNSSISENELAANNFWETLIWWFRNPAFLKQILWENTGIWVSAYKQERQNLVIEVVSWNKNLTEEALRSSFITLYKNINKFNDNSDAKYMLIDQWQVFSISSSKNITYPFIGMFLFLIIAFAIIAIYEFLNWVISSIEQAESIVWSKTLDVINSNFDKNDYTLLSVAIQKMQPVVVFAWLNFDIEKLSVAIAQRQSFFWEKLLLVDWDLQKRSLQHALWLSSRLKNLKWLTNISHDFIKVNNLDLVQGDSQSLVVNTENDTNLFLQNTLDDNLKFIPAWTWNWFLTEIFQNLSHQMRTLIHTQLPENAEILRLSKASLVLVIKLWKSKTADLRKIKEVWGNEIKLVVIK